MGFQATALLQILVDERGTYVAGANDTTAVARLLTAAQLHADPLRHTEVWPAFIGAEEVMCEGDAPAARRPRRPASATPVLLTSR